MFKHHNLLGLCLTLAFFMGGFSDVQAEIIIDPFDEGDQQAPPDNELPVESALGGFRLLEQIAGENVITVEASPGILLTGSTKVGGETRAEWSGGDDVGLGGIDLTEGGDRFTLSGVVLFGTFASDFETLTLRVTDTDDGVSTFAPTYGDICDTSLACMDAGIGPVGTYEIPFSSLSGGADLTSVDAIALEFFTTPLVSDVAIEIASFQVVPEPSTGLLFGSALLGLIGIARRKQTKRSRSWTWAAHRTS